MNPHEIQQQQMFRILRLLRGFQADHKDTMIPGCMTELELMIEAGINILKWTEAEKDKPEYP